MAKTYLQIQQEIAVLSARAEKVRVQEISGLVTQIKQKIKEYGLTAEDLGLGKSFDPVVSAPANAPFIQTPIVQTLKSPKSPKALKEPKTAKGPKASKSQKQAKYMDGMGHSWGGIGNRPSWLREKLAAGATLESFAVNSKPQSQPKLMGSESATSTLVLNAPNPARTASPEPSKADLFMPAQMPGQTSGQMPAIKSAEVAAEKAIKKTLRFKGEAKPKSLTDQKVRIKPSRKFSASNKGDALSMGPLTTAGAISKGSNSKSKAQAQFQDPDTGKTWSGRGARPDWFKNLITGGRSFEELRISNSATH